MTRKHDPALDVLTSLHRASYGAWSGRPAGSKPVARQCCEEVHAHRWGFSQCSRTRGHGPEGAYCKQHDPAAVKARDAARSAKWAEDARRSTLQAYGPTFFKALCLIADGHNDPRAVATEAVAKFRK